MNKQIKTKNGMVVGRGIEWTDYTSNPASGCLQGCEWLMPNGVYAKCYAEDTANGVAQGAYPQGFEHYYWRPVEMDKWKTLPAGSKVFVGSMADTFGHWVPSTDIQAVIDHIREVPNVTFQLLTKNPKRMLDFEFPKNAWLMASTPPSRFWHKDLSERKREQLMVVTMQTLAELRARGNITGLSAEPLNIDLNNYIDSRVYRLAHVSTAMWEQPVDWVIIGAASNGKQKFAPDETLVRETVEACNRDGIKLFFKGNMESLPWAKANWHEEFPGDSLLSNTPQESMIQTKLL